MVRLCGSLMAFLRALNFRAMSVRDWQAIKKKEVYIEEPDIAACTAHLIPNQDMWTIPQ